MFPIRGLIIFQVHMLNTFSRQYALQKLLETKTPIPIYVVSLYEKTSLPYIHFFTDHCFQEDLNISCINLPFSLKIHSVIQTSPTEVFVLDQYLLV